MNSTEARLIDEALRQLRRDVAKLLVDPALRPYGHDRSNLWYNRVSSIMDKHLQAVSAARSACPTCEGTGRCDWPT